MSYFDQNNPEMDEYLENHTSDEPEILQRLRKDTYLRTTQPHMISGYQQGRLLSIIARIVKPNRILEIGTFTGYATLCLAEGLSKDGTITTLDINSELAYLPKKYFDESIYSQQIDFQIINAKNYLNDTTDFFDLVFIDADKESYLDYFYLVKERIKSGAVVLFDNVLWYGKVLEEKPKKKSTITIKALNKAIAEDKDFENLILPLRDGVNLLLKK